MEEKIVNIPTERALNLCSLALGDDAQEIKHELDNGFAESFVIHGCCFITRFETFQDKKTLVVICAEGKNLKRAGVVIVQIAKHHNCDDIRMHSERPALQRLLKSFGFVQQEIVYKMVL